MSSTEEHGEHVNHWLPLKIYGIFILGWVLSIALYLIIYGNDKLRLTTFNNESLPVVMAQYLIIIVSACPGVFLIAIFSDFRSVVKDAKKFIDIVKKELNNVKKELKHGQKK